MRDYDPTLGRYLQADPLGLYAGAGLYDYGYQNPMYWSDPTGECPICLGIAVFAAVALTPDAANAPGQCDLIIEPDPAAPYINGVTIGITGVGVGVGVARAAGATAGKGLGSNPFKGKTATQIEKMLLRKGYTPKGTNPLKGQGTYVNPKTGRSYHLNLNHPPGKPPHVGVIRPRGYGNGNRRGRAGRDYTN